MNRTVLDSLAGLDLSELDDSELERLWPALYRHYLVERTEPVLMKSHDRWRLNDLGAAIFPAELSAGVLHIVRDPRDICVSWSHFFATDTAEVAKLMANPDASIAAPIDQYSRTAKQSLGSWSDHANSWLEQHAIPILTLRYEDMLMNPIDSFGSAAIFCGLDVNAERIHQAIEDCQFANLQSHENADAALWKPAEASRVVRRGQAGAWQDELPAALASRIALDHATTMRHFGYLPKGNA